MNHVKIKRTYSYRKVKIFILISGIIASLISIDMTGNSLFKNQFIIPMLYSILYFTIMPGNRKFGIGTFMLNISLFCRYIIYPILNRLSGFYTYSMYKIDENSVNNAIVLMFIEMITILITYRIYYSFKNNNYIDEISTNKVYVRPIIPCIFLFVTMIIIILYPHILKKYTFILSEAPSSQYVGDIPTIIQLIFGWTKTLLPLLIIVLCKVKYNSSMKVKWVIYACIIGSVNMIFYTGTSRISILIPSVTTIFLLSRIFPHYRKYINISLGTIALLGTLSITMYKFFGDESLNDIVLNNNIREWTRFFNIYFQGIDNVALGYEAENIFKNMTNLGTMFNDIFSSAMGFTRFVNYNNTSIAYFNEYIYNHSIYADQIVPTIVQGYMYFGWWLCFIPTLLMTLLILKLDELSIRCKSIEYKYIYGLGAAMIGFMIAGNITHMGTTIFNSLIPYSIILFLNRIKISKE